MRVAFNTMYRSTIDDVNRAAQNLSDKQQEVSSGLRVRVPSDDPGATVVAISEQNQLSSVNQFSSNASAATARLNITDSVMSDMLTQLTQAKTVAASMLNSTATASQRQGAVATLQSVRDALVSDFNTTYHGSYLFSGSKSTTAAFSQGAGGVVSAYQGDSNPISISIDQQISVAGSFDGSVLSQGGAATDVFTDIDNLITAIQGSDMAGTSTGLQNLGAAFDRVTAAQTVVGVNEQTVTGEQLRQTTAAQAATTRLSQAQDANMAQAISGLAQATTAQKAALGAAATLNQVSLFDYLR
ncbi:MAG TPA: flagellar hook-associated protein FlgL [Vicinamibacterales bacterium]